MKWKLSKDGFDKRDGITEKKSMSYAVNEKDKDIVVNNQQHLSPPPKLATTSSSFHHKHKLRANDANDGHLNRGAQTEYQKRLSLEEALKNSNPDSRYRYDGDIFVISTNQTGGNPPMPWTTSTATQTMMMTHTPPRITTNLAGDTNSKTNVSNLDGMMMLDNYASETNNDFHYINTTTTSNPSTGSLNKNGSTTKLLPPVDDQSSKQSKCSIFRGLVLCLCLNLTYANVVRFPRELDRHGSAFLVPYFIILLLVGLPIILLEVSLGQFLGQGSGNSWRASPIFKGACVIGRFASWLSTIWVSLQAVLAISYIGMLIFKSVPFSDCVGPPKITDIGYTNSRDSGQKCLERTFLVPVWENLIYFGLLTISLIFLWIITMPCTHNAKVFRRISFLFGFIGFSLLLCLTGWEVHKSLEKQYFPEIWSFNETIFTDCNIWFNALIQVIFSTNIGFGAIPVFTGKFLYKGDAVRTAVVYLCFNLLVNAISVTLFMVQYDNEFSLNSTELLYPELKPLTAIYDNVSGETDYFITRLIPGFMYSLIVVSSIISITTAIYTSSRIVPRHPNYILCLIALVVAVSSLLAPEYGIARVLDSRIIGTLVILSLIFDLIATTWVYGAKNIYTDLEFSIGRPIFKTWIILWCFAPVALTAILVWWSVGDDQDDLWFKFLPRWAPFIFVLAIIVVIACIEISKQVDYNFFGMICEAAKPAKDWGPADPLARHAWKQWRSVCQDTGRKDFTLRRRGTRDYTHSIKKGQYSTTKYGTPNWKTSTPGSSSPNYSGSVFGDSAIEEDMSVDKYSGVNQQFSVFSTDSNGRPPTRYSSNRSHKLSTEKRNNSRNDKHRDVLYIRRSSADSNNATKIEITPTGDTIEYTGGGRTHTLTAEGRPSINSSQENKFSINSQKDSQPKHHQENDDHICWRKFSVNTEEYSTEL